MANVSSEQEGADSTLTETVYIYIYMYIYTQLYIYIIILFLKKAVSRVEDLELCMRQETGVGCAK